MIDTQTVTVLLADFPWLALLAQCLAALLAGAVLHGLLQRLARRAASRLPLFAAIVRHTRRPLQFLLPLLLVHLVLNDVEPLGRGFVSLRQLLSIAIVLLVTLFIVRLIAGVGDFVVRRSGETAASEGDPAHARSVQTKVQVLARTAMFIVGVLGVGSVLMTFPNVRQIGASLLASAGVAGIVAGLAARPVLGNLIAGLQIALTQPLRIDDVLIIENEWGRVEEITETYVVVCTWDERRLIIPLEHFIQKPFQNWTRNSSKLIGSVHFWVDYQTSVPPLRDELQRIVAAAPEWDGRVCALQVTDFSERAMQLRVIVSAADAGRSWDLRCRVREELIAYLQREYPQMLPQTRTLISEPGGATLAGRPTGV